MIYPGQKNNRFNTSLVAAAKWIRGNREILLLVLPLVLLAGWRTEIAPEMTIQVVDQYDVPWDNVTVSQWWYHYSLKYEAGYERKKSDQLGRVTFAARREYFCIGRRLFYPFYNIWSSGFHASWGASVGIYAYNPQDDNSDTGSISYHPGKEPLPIKIVLTRVKKRIKPEFR